MLRTRFDALWRRAVAPEAGAVGAYSELQRRYSEPHRFYHTLGHVSHCLTQFDLARDGIPEPDSVEMAIWFHDAVYDPWSQDNELESAKLFRDLSRASDTEFRNHVYDLIMVTVHPSEPANTDQQYIVDIDLSGFALPWEDFRKDSVAVRQEYAHVQDDEFCQRQKKFLETLMQRPHFYYTEYFRSRYEQAARENIARQIDALRTTDLS